MNESAAGKQDKRGANFTQNEISVLVDIVLQYKHVIENKRTDGTTTRDKNEAWEAIADTFNSSCGNFSRQTKTIRAKYENVKKNLRKKCAHINKSHTKTGGGKAELENLMPYEEKVLAVCEKSMIGLASVDGDDDNKPEDTNSSLSSTINVNDELHIEFLEELCEEDSGDMSFTDKPAASFFTKATKCVEASGTIQAKSTPTSTKFPFKNPKPAKNQSVQKNRIDQVEVNMDAKLKLIQYQTELVQEEIEQKRQISALTIENLRLDIELKKAQLKKLLN